MISKKAIRKGRANDDKNIKEEDEPVMKALDLYSKDGTLLTQKEKFRELNLSYHGIQKSHKQKEKMTKKMNKSHVQENTDISKQTFLQKLLAKEQTSKKTAFAVLMQKKPKMKI